MSANQARHPTSPRRVRRQVVAALVLLALPAVAVQTQRPGPTTDVPTVPQGDLAIASAARGSYDVGAFTVALEAARVTVGHAEAADGDVWASPQDAAFLGAARATLTATDRIGMLRITDRWDETLFSQTIDAAERDTDDALVLRGRLAGDGTAVDYRLVLRDDDGAGGLAVTAETEGGDVDRLTWVSALAPGEQVHGLGEQFAPFDLRGHAYPIITREQGIGRGEQPLSLLVDLVAGAAGARDTTYAPLPHYITSAPRSLWLRAPSLAVVDLRAQGRAAVTGWGHALQVLLPAGATPAEHVSTHARATGLMRELPSWTGAGVVAGLQGGTAEVRRKVAVLRRAGVPLSAVWLQDWVGQRETAFGARLWWNWTLDRERYRDFEQLVDDLAADGIRVLTYVNPFLSPDAGERADRDLYAEAAAAGHLITTDHGQPYLLDQGGFQAGLVDLFDPEARAWFVDVIVEEVLGTGATGFMADFGEELPLDGVSSAGRGVQLHNRYPAAWASVTREALERAGIGEEGLAFHRSAAAGSVGDATMFWAGDQLVDFSAADGLPSALDGLLAGGVSGMSLNHFDIGGYTSVALPSVLPDVARSTELAQRSAELAAFTAMMRTHEGNRPDLGASVTDEPVAAHLAEMGELFVALDPERRRLAAVAAAKGLPLVRHPLLVVPGEHEVVDQGGVFFLGEDLFVAPVLAAGVEEVTVRLPAGAWQQIWTGEVVRIPAGSTDVLTAPAPIGRPAAWARTGSPVAGELAAWRTHR